jgi:pimeloyl-ACP methyl ester carboxylesterase
METTTSDDGTVIAYDRAGEGPVLIVSVGAFCNRLTFVPTDELKQQFTVVTYDRRGRGDSGDTEPFAPEREHEDLAAVAAATGSEPPFLYGHSSGAAIALRAVSAGLSVAAVAAYEAPFGTDGKPSPSTDPDARIRELVSAGRRDKAVEFWMAEVIGLPAQALDQMRGAPWVAALQPYAPVLPYELAAVGDGMPVGELGKITVPALILGGGNSPDWFQRSVAEQAAAIPGASLELLAGHDHNVPHEVIAPVLAGFFNGHR